MSIYCVRCFAKVSKQGVPHRVRGKRGGWCGGIEPVPGVRSQKAGSDVKPANSKVKSSKPTPKQKKPLLVRSVVSGGLPGSKR